MRATCIRSATPTFRHNSIAYTSHSHNNAALPAGGPRRVCREPGVIPNCPLISLHDFPTYGHPCCPPCPIPCIHLSSGRYPDRWILSSTVERCSAVPLQGLSSYHSFEREACIADEQLRSCGYCSFFVASMKDYYIVQSTLQVSSRLAAMSREP